MIKTRCGIKNGRPSFDRDAIRFADKLQDLLFYLPFRMFRIKSKSCDLKFRVNVRCFPTNEQKTFLKVGLNDRTMISGFERVEINRTVYKV